MSEAFADILWERFSEAAEAGLGAMDWSAISRVARGCAP